MRGRRLQWGDINYYRSRTLSYLIGPIIRKFDKQTGKYKNVGRVPNSKPSPHINGESELDEFSIMLLDYEPENEEEEKKEEEEHG